MLAIVNIRLHELVCIGGSVSRYKHTHTHKQQHEQWVGTCKCKILTRVFTEYYVYLFNFKIFKIHF